MLTFELNAFFWTAETKLDVWAGFQERRGPYGSKSSESPSDGSVSINFAPEGRDTSPMTRDELQLVDWFVRNHQDQADHVLRGILAAYPSIRLSYLDAYGDEDVSDILPQISTVDQLRPVIGLHDIHIHQLSRSSIPYVGYEFGCEWDDGHGMGVLAHGNRIVDIGGADTAILLWIAEKDAETTASP